MLGVREAHQQGYQGTGVTVGLVDTGVWPNHMDLIHRVKDFRVVTASDRVEPAHAADAEGHGTCQAGIVAGGRAAGVQIGGAPGAQLAVVSAVGPGRRATAVTLLSAVDWLAGAGASVILVPLGFRTAPSAGMRIFDLALKLLRQHGIICIAPVGNIQGETMAPARFDSVVACGAVGPDGEMWADSGARPDFVLPGQFVFSCAPPGMQRFGGQQYAWMTGTSMAAAHMAALFAIALQAVPEATASELTGAFMATASNREYEERSGWGIPDVMAAIELLREKPEPRTYTKPWEIGTISLPQTRELADVPLIAIGDHVEPALA